MKTISLEEIEVKTMLDLVEARMRRCLNGTPGGYLELIGLTLIWEKLTGETVFKPEYASKKDETSEESR